MFFISWIPNLSDSPELGKYKLNDLMNQGVDLLQIDHTKRTKLETHSK